MGDTDQRSKQVEGVEVAANVAALDRALHQRIDSSLDQPARTLKSFEGPPTTLFSAGAMICFAAMWSTNSSIHARNASIGGMVSANLRCRRSQLFHFTPIDRFDQGVARGKVTIQSSGSDTRLFGNIVQAGVGAKAGKRLLRHFQNALAVALRVCARLSLGGL